MYKYLTATVSAIILALSYNAMARFDYTTDTDTSINSYGYYGDLMSELNCPGSNEYFEAFKINDVNFDFNSSRLKRRETGKHTIVTATKAGVSYNKLVLERQAKYLKDHPFTDVFVVGSTDVHGSHAYNRKLGMRRAEVVKKYLVKQGVDANRIHVVSVGEDNVKYKNNPDNRRVDANVQD